MGHATRAGERFRTRCEAWALCTNLGDVKTLASHPASTSHGRLTEAQRQQAGIGQGLVRLAVGLEHVADLQADLERGFAAL